MNFWYRRSWQAYLLLPLSGLFWLISRIRYYLYQRQILPSYRSPVPVVVVGNLSVGGNGKTPAVIWLVEQLQQQGLKVGIISRGYGSRSSIFPLLVDADSDPIFAGDEPVLLAQRTQVPLAISPNRKQAIELLLQHFDCDVIISDDGLQHYALQRDKEIVLMDSERGSNGLGNGFLLPAGPLRECPKRLQQVDLIIANGKANLYSQAEMELVPCDAVNLVSQQTMPLEQFKTAVALAGIGNPSRFFKMLENLGIKLEQTLALADHQAFSPELFKNLPKNTPHLMTEKDAVKCLAFAQPNWWYVPVKTKVQGEKAEQFIQQLVEQIIDCKQQREHSKGKNNE